MLFSVRVVAMPSEPDTGAVQFDTNGELTITFEGGERFAAMRRAIVVERATITRLRHHPEMTLTRPAVRRTGVAWRNRFCCYSFRGREGDEFWYLTEMSGSRHIAARNVVEILSTGRFSRLLLTATVAEAQQLAGWLGTPE